jgi:enoyl-CoA hydratase/carnithine racemase
MLDVETDGPLRTITLSRPERRNALTPAALDDLRDAVRSAVEPVVYLHGAGPAFCAGADLDVVEELNHEEGVAFARRGQRTARAIETADAVVVAGVDGAARGGGVELALACDLTVATPGASFAETGVTLGLFGAWGGTVRLPETLSDPDAYDLALSGRVVDADEALRMGLASRIVEDPRSVARELAENDHLALRAIKRRLRDRDDPRAQERREAEVFGDLIAARNGTGSG